MEGNGLLVRCIPPAVYIGVPVVLILSLSIRLSTVRLGPGAVEVWCTLPRMVRGSC